MESSSERIGLFELLSFAVHSWRYILANCIIVGLVAIAIVLLVQETYLAETTLLPPEESSTSIGLISSMRGSDFPMLALMGEGITPAASTLAILESNTVGNRIAEQFDLIEYYDASNDQAAVRTLHFNTELRASDAGIIQILVEDKDPEMAATLANAHVEELDKFNREVRSWKAKRVREFVEDRLNATEADLAEAEEELKAFQEEYGAVQLDEQATAILKVMTDLRTRLAEQRMRLDIASQYAAPTNPEIVELRESIRALEAQLGQLEAGETTEEDATISFSEMPTLAMQYSRLFRDVTALASVIKLLKEQLEQAKIEEARDTPTVQVLDQAIPPDLRHSPRRTVTVIAAVVLAFFAGILIAMLVGAFRISHRQGGPAQRVADLTDYLIKDAGRLFRIRRS
jgi:uncharacterized protein involved in exopolysaccharide biosynthesis